MNDECLEMKDVLKALFFIVISLLFLYWGHLMTNEILVFLAMLGFTYFMYLGSKVFVAYIACLDDYNKRTKL